MSGKVMCSWVACLRSFCAAIRMSAAFLRSASDSMGRSPSSDRCCNGSRRKIKGRVLAAPHCAGLRYRGSGLARFFARPPLFSLLDLAVGEMQHAGKRPRIGGTSWARSARPTGSIQTPSTGRNPSTPPPVSAMPAGTRTQIARGWRKAVKVAAGPVGHVALQAVHFLVKVGLVAHARSKARAGICSRSNA